MPVSHVVTVIVIRTLRTIISHGEGSTFFESQSKQKNYCVVEGRPKSTSCSQSECFIEIFLQHLDYRGVWTLPGRVGAALEGSCKSEEGCWCRVGEGCGFLVGEDSLSLGRCSWSLPGPPCGGPGYGGATRSDPHLSTSNQHLWKYYHQFVSALLSLIWNLCFISCRGQNILQICSTRIYT